MQQLQLLKENLLYILLVVLILIGGIYFNAPKIGETFNNAIQLHRNQAELKAKEEQAGILRMQLEQSTKSEPSKDGKKIFESTGGQFSADASFATLFEMFLNTAQQSGIRIRAIDYNYAPEEDAIFTAKLPGYNVCELKVIAVGSYTELQTFFKGIMKDKYLTNLAEVELRPWEKDKTILIARFKLRLYTKTS